MYKQFYAGMAYEYLPLFALLLFMAVFIGTAVKLFSRRAAEYDPLAQLPLNDPSEFTTTTGPASPAPRTEDLRHG